MFYVRNSTPAARETEGDGDERDNIAVTPFARPGEELGLNLG
jgi:hypothetical protein